MELGRCTKGAGSDWCFLVGQVSPGLTGLFWIQVPAHMPEPSPHPSVPLPMLFLLPEMPFPLALGPILFVSLMLL